MALQQPDPASEQIPVIVSTAQDNLVMHSASTPGQSSNSSNTIILRMNSPINSQSSTKLKSLIPKNLLGHIFKQESTSSCQVLTDADVGPEFVGNVVYPSGADVSPQFAPIRSIVSSSGTPILINSSSEGIDSYLHNFSNNGLPTESVSINEDVKPAVSVTDQYQEKTVLCTEPLQLPSSSEVYTISAAGNADSVLSNATGKVGQVSSQTFNEKEQDSDIIKKTMVEAFVKMVVCRKVTVQRVHSKTGQVLDTKVKTEEEDPVILGVDCVETTEDLIAASAFETDGLSTKTDFPTSKWGASLDGGLKFLSAVSESRQKLDRISIKDKLLKKSNVQCGISLKSRIASSESTETKAHDGYTIKVSPLKKELREEKEAKSDSDVEWDEDMNDGSDDFVPNGSQKNLRKSIITTRNQKEIASPSLGSKFSKTFNEVEFLNPNESVVLLPKKRGRKRKWDNALGLASNLRSCQFCNKHFRSVQRCAKHMKKGNCVSSVYCFICSKAMENEQELEKHLSTHGNESRGGYFECQDCHRSYRTRAGYVKHFRMGTCQKRYEFEDGHTGNFQCERCESRFSSEDYLKLHIYKVHENPQDRHDCSDCGKKFYSLQGFQKHRSGRSCIEPLKCHICGKTYSNKAKESFKIHMKHHRSEVTGITFNCEECGRSYMTQIALNKHKLSHTGVKPYRCEICGKEFSMRYMVKDHARMHTGERPYLCSLCGSAFSNKGHLGRHLRSHENGTLLKRGRPKKIRDPEESVPQETELKMIDLSQALQNLDGQAIQVVDGQIFNTQSNGTPMIIQADNNTIIIAEGWPNASSNPAVSTSIT